MLNLELLYRKLLSRKFDSLKAPEPMNTSVKAPEFENTCVTAPEFDSLKAPEPMNTSVKAPEFKNTSVKAPELKSISVISLFLFPFLDQTHCAIPTTISPVAYHYSIAAVVIVDLIMIIMRMKQFLIVLMAIMKGNQLDVFHVLIVETVGTVVDVIVNVVGAIVIVVDVTATFKCQNRISEEKNCSSLKNINQKKCLKIK